MCACMFVFVCAPVCMCVCMFDTGPLCNIDCTGTHYIDQDVLEFRYSSACPIAGILALKVFAIVFILVSHE